MLFIKFIIYFFKISFKQIFLYQHLKDSNTKIKLLVLKINTYKKSKQKYWFSKWFPNKIFYTKHLLKHKWSLLFKPTKKFKPEY